MKLNELKYGEHFTCVFEPYLKKSENLVDKSNPLGVLQKGRSGDSYILQYGMNFKMARLVKCGDISALNNRLSASKTNLFEVKNTLKDNRIEVEIVFFREFRKFDGDVLINITENFVKAASELHFGKKDGNELCKKLSFDFTLGSFQNPYFLFMENHGTSAENENFTLVNKDYQISIKSGKIKEETALFAVGIKNRTPRNFENSACLAQGRLKFSFLTEKTISERNAAEIQKNLSAGTSYIGKWDEYNAEIGKRLLENARKVGYAVVLGKIENSGINEILVNFSFNNESGDFGNLSADTDKIDLVTELPDYLKNPDLTYDEWIKGVDERLEAENILRKSRKTDEEKEKDEESKKWSNLKIVEVAPDYMKIERKVKEMPSRGENGELFIILSIAGDKIQVERRRRARLKIVEGKSEISNLGLILDGNANSFSNVPPMRESEKKMSLKVQKKIFKFDPTENQKQAVRIALNTSDITVIQGPPGTGKTTVICAIIESLNEDFQKDSNLAGKIFVSGLQHDAVHNITKRLSVNALPTIKFGRSSTEDELSLSATEARVAQWSRNTADEIEEKTPAVRQSLEFQRLLSLFLDYHKSPSVAMEKKLLNGIKNLSERFTTPAIIERIDAILSGIDGTLSSGNSTLLKTVRALRTDEVSFLDDGKKRALDLKIRLENEGISIPNSLKVACEWEEGKPLSFLNDLESLRSNLIEENLPAVEYRRKKENAVISQIVSEVSARISQYPFDPSEKKNLALAEFVYELRNNPDGITNTLLGYNPVFAATVQQSEGREISNIRKRLGLDSETESKAYEYVIIDEAARVAPPDLLIPMAKGKHVILVGDQRQLPQQVDQEIERKMEEGAASKEEVSYLNESTFERLFKQFGSDKKITLNKQYRMHPLLGNFVSEQFYDPHGEGFESPLGADKFEHSLPFISGRAAVWCNVENDSGNGAENKNVSKSRYRRGEAICAAKLLKSWLEYDSEKKMTFGVISFYSAQCTEIKKQLESFGICEKTSDGTFEIAEEYKFTAPDEKGESEERIRIGTVDAFQGMEFDAVILCAVRSALPKRIENAGKDWQKNEEEGLKAAQELFGFLMSKNRLCVSMSREKKALVVIGDKALFTSEIAKEAVPELYHFYELCENKEKNSGVGIVLDRNDLIKAGE